MTRSAHADNAAYIATSGTATREASSLSVYAGYQKQLELMGMPRSEGPDIRWLIDPTDYLRPIVFDTNDKNWRDSAKEQKIRQFCGSGDGGHHH